MGHKGKQDAGTSPETKHKQVFKGSSRNLFLSTYLENKWKKHLLQIPASLCLRVAWWGGHRGKLMNLIKALVVRAGAEIG